MSIYTRTGDNGTTSLFGGKRISKSSLQVEAYGSVDELSSFIGLVILKLKEDEDKGLLTGIQKDCYQLMAALSGSNIGLNNLNKQVKKFEQYIDETESKLPKLNRFILPQGNKISCWFHILRTVCRRVEREVARFVDSVVPFPRKEGSIPRFSLQWEPSPAKGGRIPSRSKRVSSPYLFAILKYLNRLSDLFFIMARKYNTKELKVKS